MLNLLGANGRRLWRFRRKEKALNYRHHFHAGNFADLLKHAILLDVAGRMTAHGGPLTVLDTHAGAGLYDLEGEAARKSGEAAAGVVRLIADAEAPAVFDPLKTAVSRVNGGSLRHYPGSPLVALGSLRAGDRYVGCELRRDDQAELATLLARQTGARAQALLADGYQVLAEGNVTGRRLVLIDPPFERGDEYPRVVEAVAADASRTGEAVYLIWTPLKDLQTFDSFLGGLEASGLGAGLAVETRLRRLDDPLRMNGCAVVMLAPRALLDAAEPAARAAAEWIARTLGEPGAEARIERLS